MSNRKETLPKDPADFKALQAEWYKKLADSGFKDIEDTTLPDRPLLEWHSFKFISERSQNLKAKREQYQRMAENLLNHENFPRLSRLMVRHGLSKLSAKQVRTIWAMHCEGASERRTARTLSLAKTTVHDALARCQQWMKLV